MFLGTDSEIEFGIKIGLGAGITLTFEWDFADPSKLDIQAVAQLEASIGLGTPGAEEKFFELTICAGAKIGFSKNFAGEGREPFNKTWLSPLVNSGIKCAAEASCEAIAGAVCASASTGVEMSLAATGEFKTELNLGSVCAGLCLGAGAVCSVDIKCGLQMTLTSSPDVEAADKVFITI